MIWNIISLRREIWTHTIILIPPLFIEVSAPSQGNGRSCICVLVVLTLPLFSMIFYSVPYFILRSLFSHAPAPQKTAKDCIQFLEHYNKIDKCMKSGNETYLELLVRSTGEPCGIWTFLGFAQLVTKSNLIKMATTVIHRCIVVCCWNIYRA